MGGNDGPDLLELFRMHAQERQKEAVNLLCNEVKRLSRTKEIKRLLVLGKYAGNPELCEHGFSCIQGCSGIAVPFTGQGYFVQVADEYRLAL